MIPLLASIIEHDYEHMVKCMKILQSYLLLGGPMMIKSNIEPILQLLHRIIDDQTVEDSSIVVFKVVEILVVLSPSESIMAFQSVLVKIFTLFLSQQESIRVKIPITSTLCRLLLHHQQYFLGFFHQLNQQAENSEYQNNVLHLTLLSFLEMIENMPEFRRRKTTILAVLSLINVSFPLPPLCPPAPSMEQHYLDFYSNLVIIAVGVAADEEAGEGPEARILPDASEVDDQELYVTSNRAGSNNNKDWANLYQSDPINTIAVRPYLLQQLRELETRNVDFFRQVISKIPQAVLQSLQG